MKKALLVLAMLSFGASAAISTGDKKLPQVVEDNMFCVGYTQAIYETTEPDTSVNNEAEAAMQYFYDRGFKLNEQYHVDDGEPESGGGKDSMSLNMAFSLGYATYLRYRTEMPQKCISVYGKAVRGMSTKELMEPYKDNK